MYEGDGGELSWVVKKSCWRTRSDINMCGQKTGLPQPSSKPLLCTSHTTGLLALAGGLDYRDCCSVLDVFQSAPLPVRYFFPSPPHFCQSRTLKLSMTNTTTTVTPQTLSRCTPGRQDGEGYG